MRKSADHTFEPYSFVGCTRDDMDPTNTQEAVDHLEHCILLLQGFFERKESLDAIIEDLWQLIRDLHAYENTLIEKSHEAIKGALFGMVIAILECPEFPDILRFISLDVLTLLTVFSTDRYYVEGCASRGPLCEILCTIIASESNVHIVERAAILFQRLFKNSIFLQNGAVIRSLLASFNTSRGKDIINMMCCIVNVIVQPTSLELLRTPGIPQRDILDGISGALSVMYECGCHRAYAQCFYPLAKTRDVSVRQYMAAGPHVGHLVAILNAELSSALAHPRDEEFMQNIIYIVDGLKGVSKYGCLFDPTTIRWDGVCEILFEDEEGSLSEIILKLARRMTNFYKDRIVRMFHELQYYEKMERIGDLAFSARTSAVLFCMASLANCDEDVGIALITGSGVMQFICENMDPMDPKNEREFQKMMDAIFRWDNSKEILMSYGEFFREMAEQHETDMDYDGVARTYAPLLTILYDKGEMPHTDFEFGHSVYDDYSGNASPLASGDEYD